MDSTQVRQPPAIPAFFGVGAVLLGGVVGLLAAPVASWLVGQIARTPIPPPRLLEVVAGLPLVWSLPIGLALGVVAGVGLAAAVVQESLTLTVDADGIEYRQKGRDGWLDHAQVASVHREGRYAVVLDSGGGVLARLDADGIQDQALQATLTAHGYRYLEADPFDADYRRWQDGRPGLSEAEHRLLRRWRESAKDAAARFEVEKDLRKAHLAVREHEGRIEVRRTAGSGHGTHR